MLDWELTEIEAVVFSPDFNESPVGNRKLEIFWLFGTTFVER